MDSFVKLPTTERQQLFEEAAARDGRMTAQLMEKDFWVCWTLRRLFQLESIHDHLTFKGGTSLSKVYGVIHRFSEDIDLSIERDFLGFGGDHEPEAGQSGKEQQRRIKGLKQACQQILKDEVFPELTSVIKNQLKGGTESALSLDENDADCQTLLFFYPAAVGSNLSTYFPQSIKIEFGAKSDHFPVEKATVEPYFHTLIPSMLQDEVSEVRVLDAKRTFWEKATILHKEFHRSLDSPLPIRLSRHFYDLVQLADAEIGNEAIEEIEILNRVAEHKNVFFKTGWANYQDAKPGTLRLIPRDERIAEIEADYANMQPMFFGEAPSFPTLLTRLGELEGTINDLGDKVRP